MENLKRPQPISIMQETRNITENKDPTCGENELWPISGGCVGRPARNTNPLVKREFG